VLVTVFFPSGRLCKRTFSITETEPDHYSVVAQLAEEIRALRGPLFDRMRKLPPHAIRQIKENGWSSLIVVDGTTYSVLPDGSIIFAFDPPKILSPQMCDPDTP
jgi:hypothetical protein